MQCRVPAVLSWWQLLREWGKVSGRQCISRSPVCPARTCFPANSVLSITRFNTHSSMDSAKVSDTERLTRSVNRFAAFGWGEIRGSSWRCWAPALSRECLRDKSDAKSLRPGGSGSIDAMKLWRDVITDRQTAWRLCVSPACHDPPCPLAESQSQQQLPFKLRIQ